MNENVTMTATETYSVAVVGDDVIELRARAWDALQGVLGGTVCERKGDDVESEPLDGFDEEFVAGPPVRDPVDRWVATILQHGPNPGRFKQLEDGTVVEDTEAPKLLCQAVFTRDEPARATFA